MSKIRNLFFDLQIIRNKLMENATDIYDITAAFIATLAICKEMEKEMEKEINQYESRIKNLELKLKNME